MRLLAACALVAGCGRIGFESHGDAMAIARDTAPVGDTPLADGAPACLASYRVCDGFEAGLSATTWRSAPSGISIDTTIAHRGSASMHAHTPAVGVGVNNYANIWETSSLPLGDNPFYVRVYARLGALPATNNRMELISATQASSGGDYLFVHDVELAVYSQYSSAVMQNGTAAPIDTWFCVLWTVDRSLTATGSITLAGDEPPAMLSATQTDGSPAIDTLAFGIGFSATNVNTAQPAMDVWIDDVIVAASPVTCAD